MLCIEAKTLKLVLIRDQKYLKSPAEENTKSGFKRTDNLVHSNNV